MTPAQFWNEWQFFVTGVAAKFSRVVARYGWDADDCRQQALLMLWRWAGKPGCREMPADQFRKYVKASVCREIGKLARKQKYGDNPGDVNRLLDHRRDMTAEFVFDVLDCADPDVRDYLAYKLGLSVDRPGWSNDKFARVREDAGEFLLEQLRCELRS